MLVPTLLLMFLLLSKKDIFEQYFSKQTLEKLSVANKYMSKTSRNILFFISLILMTIALSRPVMNEKESNFKQEANAIAIAIDVSRSMLANDISPNRLTHAKRKLLDIIENSNENALAVILFAKSSFILSPLTQDFNSLKILIENLDTGINFDNGSNIFSTLETTAKLLKNYENKNLLLLSDGGNNSDFEKEIEFAKENKINIYTIGLASSKAAPIKLEDGNFLTKKDGSIVTVSLNENIKKLSLGTNGGYINYSLNNEDIKQILLDIEKKSTKKELESKKFKSYTELFYYPLALAIFILFIAFSSLPNFLSKKLASVSIILIAFFNTSTLKAFEFDFKTIDKANTAYEKGDYKASSKKFKNLAKTPEAKYNYANSLYKEKKYDKALENYKNVTTSNQDLEFKKLHNMGNSYVKLNDLENAKKMYENALKIKADKQTKENLETVQNILNKQEKQKNNKNKNNKDKNKEKNKNNKKNKDSKKNKDKEQNRQNKEDGQNNKKGNQENNKEEGKKQKQENNQEAQKQKQALNKKLQNQYISELEEKKWLKKLENKKSHILLKKVKTKNEDSSSNPW